ncbi:peptide MFS transporter [Arthrobacter sp. EH-1B-1]|uniref:Peptide MFS transporter n=1 Tax=Arthrobacter vasquezii TaxID=2977629 RepID=A0ABT6D028_9MICC|nr:peptide MFS transporter [Arthrobacter vasquezii]MDF9279195.1 peptide MFS transporter [Arthrobacter vasquezii]
MSTTHNDKATTEGKKFLGHPRMLANLFSVELWERFSFYGMQGILLYYMYYSVADGGLGIDQGIATGLVGAYGGGVYLSTILGAWLADRVMGSEKVLFYSAIMIMFGHIALALLPGGIGLAVGLVLVGVGSGGLKANATSLVGTLYAEGDERRDAGFSIFYMGINIGALIGPLLTGLAWTEFGFHYGFGLAAVGMAIGLTQYALTRKNLPETAHAVTNPLPSGRLARMGLIAAAGVVVIIIAFTTGLVTPANLAQTMAYVAIAASIAYFTVILRSKRVTAIERKRVYSFIPLFIASAAFWGLFQQQFTVVAIYADRSLDRNLFGWIMPPSFVQSINPIFIIIFAAVFAALWTKLGNRQPSSPLKFALGLVFMGVAFLLFIPFSGGGPNSTPLMALVVILLFFTWAELFLSPIGLSVATKLAPSAFRTQMVALFFLSISLGTTVAGILAGYYNQDNEVPYFSFSGITAIVLGIALALATPAIKKLMSGVR